MEVPNVVSIKDSSGDLMQSVEYLLPAPRPARLFSGRDTVSVSIMLHRAQRTNSPAANVFPRPMHFDDCFRKGDLTAARQISDVFATLRAAWARGSFPVVIKEAIALMGQSAGPTRRPIMPLPSAKRESVHRVVQRIDAGAAKREAGAR